nr:MAG TPA: Protein of unknown function (DUF1376) [Caudoviricetes sp.]
MNYVQFHVGDWDSSTRLLSPLEKGVYIDLLMLYYSVERPLMRSECERISRAYAPEEKAALEYVLDRFFHLEGEVYSHRRCDEEIAKAAEKSEKAAKSAKARWNKAGKGSSVVNSAAVAVQKECKRSSDAYADGMRMHSERSADGMLTNNQEPITNKETERKKKEKRQAITHAFNLDLLPSEWADYAKQVRPDLDPQTVFADFVFYFTKGRGTGELRSDKGWNQSWQGWVRRQKETRNAKPAGSNAHQQPEVFDEAYYEGSMNPDGTANWG